jgi:hypothetical protein
LSIWLVAVAAAAGGYLGGETLERRRLYACRFGLGLALLVALVVEAARRLRRRPPRRAIAVGGRSGQ